MTNATATTDTATTDTATTDGAPTCDCDTVHPMDCPAASYRERTPPHLPLLIEALGDPEAAKYIDSWVDSGGREFAAHDNDGSVELYQYRPALPIDLLDPRAGAWVADSDLPRSLLDPARGPVCHEVQDRYRTACRRFAARS